jgi:hypothetical protein
MEEFNITTVCEGLEVSQESPLITSKYFSKIMGGATEKNSIRVLKVQVSAPYEIGGRPSRL